MLFECEFSFSEWVSVGLLTSFIAVDVLVLLLLIFLLQFYSAHLIYVVAMFFDLPILYFTALSSHIYIYIHRNLKKLIWSLPIRSQRHGVESVSKYTWLRTNDMHPETSGNERECNQNK